MAAQPQINRNKSGAFVCFSGFDHSGHIFPCSETSMPVYFNGPTFSSSREMWLQGSCVIIGNHLVTDAAAAPTTVVHASRDVLPLKAG